MKVVPTCDPQKGTGELDQLPMVAITESPSFQPSTPSPTALMVPTR